MIMIYNSSKKNVAAVKYMDNTWRASNNKEIIPVHLYSYLHNTWRIVQNIPFVHFSSDNQSWAME